MITYLNAETGETIQSAGSVLGLERSPLWVREDDAVPTEEALGDANKTELQKAAGSRDLSTAGTKAELLTRIAAYDAAAEKARSEDQSEDQGQDAGQGEDGAEGSGEVIES